MRTLELTDEQAALVRRTLLKRAKKLRRKINLYTDNSPPAEELREKAEELEALAKKLEAN